MHDNEVAEEVTSGTMGRLELTFAADPEGGTFIDHQYMTYPFHICRPHVFAKDPCGMRTVYTQSSAGGVFDGDRLTTHIQVKEKARIHLTSQASTIVHSMRSTDADQTVTINAEADSITEFLPDPLILFPGSRIRNRLTICADKSACVITCDSFILHDPWGRKKVFDWLENETLIKNHEGVERVRDKFTLHGSDLLEQIPGVNGNYIAQGTFFVYAPKYDVDNLLQDIRWHAEGAPSVYAGASRLPHDSGLWVRCLGEDPWSVRALLSQMWMNARVSLLGGEKPIIRQK